MEQDEEDPFESILFIEDRLQQQGYKDGYHHGTVEGLKEAVEAGRNNGWDVGFEIGYCSGFIETCLRLLKKEPGQDRMLRAVTALNDRIRAFQVLNVTSAAYAKEFAQIQAKYRQVMSLLQVPVVSKDKSKLSF